MPYATDTAASLITADLVTDDLVDGATLREAPAEAPQLTRGELARIASARTARLSPSARASALVRAARWISKRLAA